MALGNSNVPIRAGRGDGPAASKIWRDTGMHGIRVVSPGNDLFLNNPLDRIHAHAPGPLLSITQKERDRIVRMTGLRPIRRFHFSSLKLNLDDVLRVGLMVAIVFQLVKLQAPSVRRTDHGHVVPGRAGERLGSFLEPSVVDEKAIVNARAGT